MIVMCSEMKWTFEEYYRQPAWFIDMIMETERLKKEYEQRKTSSSNNRTR